MFYSCKKLNQLRPWKSSRGIECVIANGRFFVFSNVVICLKVATSIRKNKAIFLKLVSNILWSYCNIFLTCSMISALP